MKREGKVVMIRQAENIRLGDPDPELFVVPDDYTEISPAQFLAPSESDVNQTMQTVSSVKRTKGICSCKSRTNTGKRNN